MNSIVRRIRANYDPDTGQWWADSDDLPGLVSEAASFEALVDRVSAVAGELMLANGARPGPLTLEFTTERQVQMA
jgi:hypothetical protein